jgi:hypothetical protein
MEEWQRRMRAEKDSERQKKNESAEILRGYRGGVKDDDLKLKTLREEERKRQLEAQQNLHSYNAKEIAIQKGKDRPVKSDQHFPEPVNAAGACNSNPLDGIVAGSVSERAATFSAFSTEESFTTTTNIAENQAAAATVVSTELNDDDQQERESTKFTDENGNLEESRQQLLVENPAILAPTPSESLEATVLNTVERPSTEDFLPTKPAASSNPVLTESRIASSAPMETELLPLRLDVLFSFGIITMQAQPEVTGYMKAVETIVSRALKNSNLPNIVYNGSILPFVKKQQWDGKFSRALDKIYFVP